eukprot:9260484-Heterocapsa_arctica.AAC.1
MVAIGVTCGTSINDRPVSSRDCDFLWIILPVWTASSSGLWAAWRFPVFSAMAPMKVYNRGIVVGLSSSTAKALKIASSRGALRRFARASSTRWLCSPRINAATNSGG